MSNPKVIIVGAGLAGLTLARTLQQSNISVTILELESSAGARDQGGCLDLHPESGQRAMREMGLLREFRKHIRVEGEEFRIVTKDNEKLLAKKGGFWETRPEIDRPQLRKILIDSLLPGTIQWETKVQSLHWKDDKPMIKLAKSDELLTADYVIGADGAWSKVRTLLTKEMPFYSSVSMVEIRHADVDKNHPEISKLVGCGTLMVVSENHCIFALRQTTGAIRTYLVFKSPENWVKECGIDFNNPTEARAAMLKQFDDYSPELKVLIETCDDTFVPRPMYMLPVGINWESKPGVTVVGDAAHLMTPFAGEGANQAMLDGLFLAHSIIKNKDRLEAISTFDKDMHSRVKVHATETAENLDIMFGPDAGNAFMNRMKQLMSGGSLLDMISQASGLVYHRIRNSLA